MGVIFKNNVLYGAGDIEISPICYSEEEREVGCWTDGKPLYKRTLAYKKSDISSGNNTITHGISNIGISVWLEGLIIYIDGNCVTLPAVGANNDWSARAYDFGTTTFVLTIGSGMYNNLKTSGDTIFITVYYTKTTDTPGSRTWTPSGIPAVHYSTEEHIVGTWIDGSTLYEKTLTFTISSTVTTLLTDNSIKLIDAKGVASKDNAGTKNLIFPYYDAGNDYMMIQQNNGTITFYCTNWVISNTPNITATIQYTKTTS